MGQSGCAFRVRFAKPSVPDICLGRVHAGISTDASLAPYLNALLDATGSALVVLGGFPTAAPDVDALTGAIASYGALLTLNAAGGSEWGLIRAADDGGFVCETPFGEIENPHLYDVWGIDLVRHAPPSELESDLARAIAELTSGYVDVECRAGWLWHYESQASKGLAAYDAWIADLSAPVDLDGDPGTMYWQGNAWMFDQLVDARASASIWLDHMADSAPGDPSPDLRQAAAVYRELNDDLTRVWPIPYRTGGYTHPNGWRIEQPTGTSRDMGAPRYTATWTPGDRDEARKALAQAQQADAVVLNLLESAKQAIRRP